MAHFLIGGAAAQLEARDRDRALQQYQYERNMDRLLANDAYARQMGEERWNYNRMNNDRQYRFNRDKFNWQKQNADFLNRRLEENDNRAEAGRWAAGLNRDEYQRTLAAAEGSAPPGTYTEFRRMNDLPEGLVNYAGLYSQDPQRRQQAVDGITRQIAGGIYNRMPTVEQAVNYQSAHPELRINPYQREAVRLRRAGEEQAALNYERQQQAAQQKHDWAMEAATGAALRQAQSAEAKAQEQSRYNHGMLAIQSELGKYTLSEGVKPEAAARVIYDIARQRNISPAEAVREVARIYGWPGGDEAETAAAQENQGGGQPVGPGVSLNSKAGTGRPGGLPGGTHGQTRTGTEGTDEHGSGVDGHGLSKEGTDGGVGTKEYRRAGDLYRGNVARIDNARERLRELTNGAFGAQTEYQRRGKPFLFTDRGYTREQEQFEFQKANQEEYEQLLNEIKKLEAENLELEKKYQRIGNPQAGFRRIKPNDTKR